MIRSVQFTTKTNTEVAVREFEGKVLLALNEEVYALTSTDAARLSHSLVTDDRKISLTDMGYVCKACGGLCEGMGVVCSVCGGSGEAEMPDQCDHRACACVVARLAALQVPAASRPGGHLGFQGLKDELRSQARVAYFRAASLNRDVRKARSAGRRSDATGYAAAAGAFREMADKLANLLATESGEPEHRWAAFRGQIEREGNELVGAPEQTT